MKTREVFSAMADMPFYERCVTARLLPDDGSTAWRRLYEKACEGPYLPLLAEGQ